MSPRGKQAFRCQCRVRGVFAEQYPSVPPVYSHPRAAASANGLMKAMWSGSVRCGFNFGDGRCPPVVSAGCRSVKLSPGFQFLQSSSPRPLEWRRPWQIWSDPGIASFIPLRPMPRERSAVSSSAFRWPARDPVWRRAPGGVGKRTHYFRSQLFSLFRHIREPPIKSAFAQSAARYPRKPGADVSIAACIPEACLVEVAGEISSS